MLVEVWHCISLFPLNSLVVQGRELLNEVESKQQPQGSCDQLSAHLAVLSLATHLVSTALQRCFHAEDGVGLVGQSASGFRSRSPREKIRNTPSALLNLHLVTSRSVNHQTRPDDK